MTRVLCLERPFHAACGGGLGRRRRRAGLRRQQGGAEREEEEAEALRQQAEVGGLAPDKQVQHHLVEASRRRQIVKALRAGEGGPRADETDVLNPVVERLEELGVEVEDGAGEGEGLVALLSSGELGEEEADAVLDLVAEVGAQVVERARRRLAQRVAPLEPKRLREVQRDSADGVAQVLAAHALLRLGPRAREAPAHRLGV